MNDDIDLTSTVSDIISHNKGRMKTVTPEQVKAFLETREDVSGPVHIADWEVPGKSGSSAGIALFTAQFGDRVLELVLRYDPGTGFFESYDLGHQFRVLKAIEELPVKSPRVYWLDESGDALGTPGFFMERIDAEAPAQLAFTTGVLAEATPEERRAMIFDTVDCLAALHSVDWQGHGLDFLLNRGAGATVIEKDLNWTWDQFTWGRPDMVDTFGPARQWLLDNQPEVDRPVLCHGDPNYGNYMFANGRVAALLDWELAQLNAPESDLAYMLYATESIVMGMGDVPGLPSHDEIKRHYETVSGHTLEHWDYYFALAVNRVSSWVLMSFRDQPKEVVDAQQGYLDFFLNRLRQVTMQS